MSQLKTALIVVFSSDMTDKTYPTIPSLALDLISTPASQVYVERVFLIRRFDFSVYCTRKAVFLKFYAVECFECFMESVLIVQCA